MRIVYCLIFCLLLADHLFAQDIRKKLIAAADVFEKDSQMRHAIYSLYVIDGKTGKIIFDKNSEIGLAPASCQKLFTSGAAFEMLGAGYRYTTQLIIINWIWDGPSTADVIIKSNGDPSLGSWRFAETKEDVIIRQLMEEIQDLQVKQVNLGVGIDDRWSTQSIPGGWIWDDIGNYYGAGAANFNWRENQYDLILASGDKIGDTVKIVGTMPDSIGMRFVSEVTSAEKGSGDNAYIYLPVNSSYAIVKGTIPIGEKRFVISGALPNPGSQFLKTLKSRIRKTNLKIIETSNFAQKPVGFDVPKFVDVVGSPILDSLNYWFLRRSINLYGEALIKTIAVKKSGYASTEKGVELVKDFWSNQGVDKSAINIIDGSGLSPQNRVTTNSLVKVLQYAKTRPWYNSFYLSLPTYNGMKMKSGSIGGARSFAGYHTSKDGKEYIFAIIVNNYDGSATAMVRKMYQVLDMLK